MNMATDHYLARDWPPDAPTAHPTTAEYALGERVRDLAHRLALAEQDRDAALQAAHRYQSESIRLDENNRALRERLEALQRANEGRRRRWPRRRRPVADGGACVCLSQVRWQR